MDAVIPFSELLRARTRRSTETAGGGSFLDDLAGGRCEVADYAELLAQYAFVHDALERATARVVHDPVVRPFFAGQRSRLPALTADLAFLVGPDWSELMSPLPATIRTIRRMCEVASTWPAGLIAHHYTRHLGDLAEGPTIARHLAEQFDFDTNGIGFILLDQTAAPEDFERTYARQLDAAPWDDEERERIAAEVVVAYDLDRAMLAELDAGRPGRLRSA